MNNKFQSLLQTYQQDWQQVTNASNLEEVEKTYLIADQSRDTAINWIFENVEEEDSQRDYFQQFGEFETNLIDQAGEVPVFDPTFDLFGSFDEYETYYQRYGCEAPEFIVSWDNQNVLWTDGSTIDYIKRPDILMSGDD